MPVTLPPTLALDLETTAPPGRDARTAHDAVPVQAGLVLAHPSGTTPDPDAMDYLVNRLGLDPVPGTAALNLYTPRGYPLLIDPGFPISAESTKIHGITTDHVDGAMTEADAVDEITLIIDLAARAGYAILAANASYDLTVLHNRSRAPLASLTPPGAKPALRPLSPPARVLDPMVIDRWADQYRKGSRKLGDLAEFYEVDLHDAHDAGADTLAALLITQRILNVAGLIDGDPSALEHPDHATLLRVARRITTPERMRSIAPMSLDTLHANQTVWAAQWAAHLQDYFRTRAPDGKRDPRAVVDGAWPIRMPPIAAP